MHVLWYQPFMVTVSLTELDLEDLAGSIRETFLWRLCLCTVPNTYRSVEPMIIGHATHVSWSTLAKEFDYCVHWVVWSYFQQFIENVRPRSGQKGQISNFINASKKGCIRCSFSSEIRWCPLFCYAMSVTCSNMHLNYNHFSIPTLYVYRRTQCRISTRYKSAIFWHTKLLFNTGTSWWVL